MEKLIYGRYAESVVVYDGTEETEREIVNLFKKTHYDDKVDDVICVRDPETSGLIIVFKYIHEGEEKPGYTCYDYIHIGDYVVYERMLHFHRYNVYVYSKEDFEKEYKFVNVAQEVFG